MRQPIPKILLCGALLALLSAGAIPAENVADEPGLATREHVDPLIIPAAAFVNDGRAAEGGYDFWPTGHLRGANTPVHHVAQVTLPNSVTIHGFSAFVFDNINEVAPCTGLYDEITLVLRRFHLQNETSEVVASVVSSGSSGLIQEVQGTVNSTRATVNNHAYVYYLDVQMCSTSHHLNAVAIDY